jgi:hypothetical protein
MPDTLTVQLDDLTLNALDELAEKTERSRASLYRWPCRTMSRLPPGSFEKPKPGLRLLNGAIFPSKST